MRAKAKEYGMIDTSELSFHIPFLFFCSVAIRYFFFVDNNTNHYRQSERVIDNFIMRIKLYACRMAIDSSNLLTPDPNSCMCLRFLFAILCHRTLYLHAWVDIMHTVCVFHIWILALCVLYVYCVWICTFTWRSSYVAYAVCHIHNFHAIQLSSNIMHAINWIYDVYTFRCYAIAYNFNYI